MGELTLDMNVIEIFRVMSENNLGAMSVVKEMLNKGMFPELLSCDTLGIRGENLYVLNNDCCGRNYDKMARTILMMNCNVFSEEQIHENFALSRGRRAIPFIDDSIKIEGVPGYDKEFGPTDTLWGAYTEAQGKLFSDKLAEIRKEKSGRDLID